MLYDILFALISLFAGVVGRICGLGGGVIIKPVMDAVGVYPVKEVTFLSACTVFAMTAWSVAKTAIKKDVCADFSVSLPLALGAGVGGAVGKSLFSALVARLPDQSIVGLCQSCVLVVMLTVSLLLTVRQDKIHKLHLHAPLACLLSGAALGLLSAFIGGGSGPINMVALTLLFGMAIKTAAINSLFIIMSAQITSIAQTVLTHTVPDVHIVTMLCMAVCAVAGAELGRQINRRIPERGVNALFSILICTLICVNLYNIINYL